MHFLQMCGSLVSDLRAPRPLRNSSTSEGRPESSASSISLPSGIPISRSLPSPQINRPGLHTAGSLGKARQEAFSYQANVSQEGGSSRETKIVASKAGKGVRPDRLCLESISGFLHIRTCIFVPIQPRSVWCKKVFFFYQ